MDSLNREASISPGAYLDLVSLASKVDLFSSTEPNSVKRIESHVLNSPALHAFSLNLYISIRVSSEHYTGDPNYFVNGFSSLVLDLTRLDRVGFYKDFPNHNGGLEKVPAVFLVFVLRYYIFNLAALNTQIATLAENLKTQIK